MYTIICSIYTFTQKKFIWKGFNIQTCPKWDFEQFDEKTQQIKMTTDN